MLKSTSRFLACRRTLCALALLSLFAGCAVKWTPLYDETLDKNVTDFQQSVLTYLAKLETESKPACLYSQNSDFYQKSQVQLEMMQTRVNASQHADKLQTIIQSLNDNVNDLRKLQQLDESKGNCMNATEIVDTRAAFQTQFEAMLAYELALKANQPPSAAPAAKSSGGSSGK
jgi:hypothetical protein